ncbi:hypothetical protein, partial [uncultured Ruminococcus sp.]
MTAKPLWAAAEFPVRKSPEETRIKAYFAVFHNFGSVVLYTFLKKIAVLPLKTYKTYGIIVVYDKGNTAQRASGDFARHLLANFSSEPVSYLPARILRAYFSRYFGKILEN